MKPTIIRNRTIYDAPLSVRSKLLCGHLSKDLKNKYHKRSVRLTEGDTVKVVRGEFKGVSGKVTQVSTLKNGVAIEGIKKEKLKGGNLDVFIHTSNVIVTDLNTEDKWRAAKLEGKSAKPAKEAKPAAPKPEPKPKAEKKEAPKKAAKQDTKETKTAKPKKESK
jgi:large subunit ribosomal protein L24